MPALAPAPCADVFHASGADGGRRGDPAGAHTFVPIRHEDLFSIVQPFRKVDAGEVGGSGRAAGSLHRRDGARAGGDAVDAGCANRARDIDDER